MGKFQVGNAHGFRLGVESEGKDEAVKVEGGIEILLARCFFVHVPGHVDGIHFLVLGRIEQAVLEDIAEGVVRVAFGLTTHNFILAVARYDAVHKGQLLKRQARFAFVVGKIKCHAATSCERIEIAYRTM